MTRFIAALSAFLISTAALAQTVNTQPLVIRLLGNPLSESYPFRGELCDQTITLNWSYTPTTLSSVCSEVTFWATTGTCGDAPVSGDVRYQGATATPSPTNRTGQISVEVAKLPGFVTTTLDDGGVAMGTACGADGGVVTNFVCGFATGCAAFGGATPTKYHPQFQLIYDTKPPTAPIITSVSGTDGTAVVNFTTNSDAANVQAETTEVTDGGADPVVYTAESASTGHVKVKNLTNNTTYSVRLRFIDAVGNVGPYSEANEVTPILTYGFWGAYKRADGTNQGGCSASWGLMPMVAALWFMMRRAAR